MSSVVPLLFGGLMLRYFGLLHPEFLPDIEPIIILSLSLVVYYAGLTIDIKNTLRFWKIIALLATVGVFLFTVITGLITYYIAIGLTLSVSIILGVILSPTDPAALFSVLESGNVKVKKKLRTILIGESCFNDAAAFITAFIILYPLIIQGEPVSPLLVIGRFLWSIVGGALSAIIVTYILGRLIERLMDPKTTKVIAITSAIVSYILAESIFASGIIASLVSGILYGNLRSLGIAPIPRRLLVGVMEDIMFIIEIFVFILLGALIDPITLPDLVVPGLAVAFIALFITRPVVVYGLSFFDKRINWAERLFISLAGTKGVTSGALALAIIARGIGSPEQILILTFITILITVTFQGTVLSILIKKLGLEEREDVLRELILKRNALREALLDLVDKYSAGEISRDVYLALSSELKDRISEIEREIGEITALRRRTIEELNTRKMILEKQIEYLNREYEEERISTELYEKMISEIRDEIDEIEAQLRELGVASKA